MLHHIYITLVCVAITTIFNNRATYFNDMQVILRKPGLWHLWLVLDDDDSVWWLKRKRKKTWTGSISEDGEKFKPPEMIPYSFWGESVKENAIVAFPLSPTEILFGRSRSLWVLLSDFVEKTISGWIIFVVVSLTRDAVKWTIERRRA